MADKQEWAKLWFSALSDEDILSLPAAKRWAWAAMIAYIKKHGINGTVTVRRDSDFLAVALGVPKEEVFNTLNCLPHLRIEEAKSEHGKIACSFTNWYKYQVDSTHAERQRCARIKKRGEEKRREENKKRPSSPLPPSSQSLGEEEKSQRRRSRADSVKLADVYDPSWANEPWPSVKAFVATYNAEAPDEWPSAERVPVDTRAAKIREYLTKFPTIEFWQTVYRNAKASQFLRSYKNAGLDWLLQRGKNDQVENCVKVFEGKYRDSG